MLRFVLITFTLLEEINSNPHSNVGHNNWWLVRSLFVKVIDENQFQLFTRPEFVSSGAAVTFTGNGGGNAHKLSMTKPLTKTIIGLDGVVQTPINFTNLAFSLGVFDGFTHNSNIGKWSNYKDLLFKIVKFIYVRLLCAINYWYGFRFLYWIRK